LGARQFAVDRPSCQIPYKASFLILNPAVFENKPNLRPSICGE
jgi:hypothetical protein